MKSYYQYSTLALSITACSMLISTMSHAAPVPNSGQLLQQQQPPVSTLPQTAVDVERAQPIPSMTDST